MGGAYGHMNHPFDLGAINTGQDLIDFFYNALESIEGSPAALKLDGVNASIKVVDGSIGGRQFAGDRGSSYEVDVSGITKARVAERWADNPTHGMIGSYRKVLDIFNESIPRIKSELQQLGMWNNPSRYFNIEFVEVDEKAKSTNVVEYDRSYIAIHGLAQFYEKKIKVRPDKRARPGFDTMTRPGLPRPDLLDDDGEPIIDPRTGNPKLVPDKGTAIPYNKEVLEKLVQIMRPIGERHGFDIYSTIPTKYKNDVGTEAVHDEFERVLQTPFRLCIDDSNCPVELPLKNWLGRAKNPKKNPKGSSDIWIKTKTGASKKVDPLNKDIYMYASDDENKLADLIDDRYFLRGPDGELTRELDPVQFVRHGGEPMPAIRPMVDAIVFWEAIKNLGHVVKNSLTSDKFGHVEEQEGIVIRDKQFGSALVKDPDSGKEFEMPLDVKITGNFITQGMDTPFRNVNEGLALDDNADEASNSLLTQIQAALGYLPAWAQLAVRMVDPTGITSWPEVARSYELAEKEPTAENYIGFVVSLLIAVPALGKAGAITKLAGSRALGRLAARIPGIVPILRKANKALIPVGLGSLVLPVLTSFTAARAMGFGSDDEQSDADDAEDGDSLVGDKAGPTIALFPGSFKPPHRGHVAALRQLVLDPEIDLVKVIVSDPQAKVSVRQIAPGIVLTGDEAVMIWKELILSLNLPEKQIEVTKSAEPSSFLTALKYVELSPEEGGAPADATVVFGCGDKASPGGESDVKRFDAVDSIEATGRVRSDIRMAKKTCELETQHSTKYLNLLRREEHADIAANIPNQTSEGAADLDFHASDFRYFLELYLTGDNNNKTVIMELLKDFVPEPKESNINSILDILTAVKAPTENIAEIKKKILSIHFLSSLVEEVLDEISVGGGSAAAVEGTPGLKKDPKNKKNRKTLIREKDINILNIEELTDTIYNMIDGTSK